MSSLPTIPNDVSTMTISALTAQIKGSLESTFASVWAVGEIGSLASPSSGHLYFNLKDKTAIIRSCMWKATAQRHRFGLKDGQEVVVRGKITVYAPRGDYQLIVDELYQKGAGAQELARRKLKEKLQKAGYFAAARKKPLPCYPRRLALIASPSGAAIRDMLEIVTRRWPATEIWVCGVCVQGEKAPLDIAAALQRLNQFRGIDVIILGRGGGSSEDLEAFNDEMVANAIFNSKIPVISAVGHEIDVTIADLVADRRALTPSEAAEIATPDRVELLEAVNARRQRLHDLLLAKYQTYRQTMHGLAQRRVLQFPLERIREQERRIDDWEERLRKAMQFRLQKKRLSMDAVAGQLQSLSPLNVLARGYSLSRQLPSGEVLRSVSDVDVGQDVEVILADGLLRTRVQSKQVKAPTAVGED